VSFDIYFQAFAHGEAADTDVPAVSAVLSPWVAEREQ
jgi:hypothetical protein